MDEDTTLSVKQTAERLGFSVRTIQYWISQGMFPNASKRNRLARNSPYRIPTNEVEQYASRLQLSDLGERG